jgi:hypothetical protein
MQGGGMGMGMGGGMGMRGGGMQGGNMAQMQAARAMMTQPQFQSQYQGADLSLRLAAASNQGYANYARMYAAYKKRLEDQEYYGTSSLRAQR